MKGNSKRWWFALGALINFWLALIAFSTHKLEVWFIYFLGFIFVIDGAMYLWKIELVRRGIQVDSERETRILKRGAEFTDEQIEFENRLLQAIVKAYTLYKKDGYIDFHFKLGEKPKDK